jgi:hypothetical protein
MAYFSKSAYVRLISQIMNPSDFLSEFADLENLKFEVEKLYILGFWDLQTSVRIQSYSIKYWATENR